MTTATTKANNNAPAAAPGVSEKTATETEQAVIDALQLIMDRIQEPQSSLEVKLFAVDSLKNQLKSSGGAKEASGVISSIPLGLKFMKEHYQRLCDIYRLMRANEKQPSNKQLSIALANVISYLSMVYGSEEEEGGACFSYLLQVFALGGPEAVNAALEEWGHEYAKRLSLEIINNAHSSAVDCIDVLIKYFLKHHAEPEACDVLVEIGMLSRLVGIVDPAKDDIHRICLYLQSCVPFEPCPEDRQMLKVIHDLYIRAADLPMALTIAIKLGDMALIQAEFNDAIAKDRKLARQFAFMLARHRINIECADAELREILFNGHLSRNFLKLAKELELLPPKTPEDIYKSHLVSGADTRKTMESPKAQLAACLVNALVNSGFGSDTLLLGNGDSSLPHAYLGRFKDSALVNAVASIGALCLWNLDEGLAVLDGLLGEPQHLPGALLGIGLLHSGIRNETDPALALIRDSLQNGEWRVRQCAALGLGFAYAGSRRDDVMGELVPLVSDLDMRVASAAGLALGNIFVGSGSGDVASVLLQTMMERDGSQLEAPVARLLVMGLGLLYLGREDDEGIEPIRETLKVIEHPIGQDASVLLTALAFAGSGNVLKTQELLQVVYTFAANQKNNSSSSNKSKKDQEKSGEEMSLSVVFAILGIALIGMGEEVGQEMTVRLFNDLMMSREACIRRTVPLALGLLYASNPTVTVVDWLGRVSHDHDKGTAQAAVMGLGLCAAGTLNAKAAQLLRQLSGSGYFQKDAEGLFIVRMAQGLVHLGKGMLGVGQAKSQRLVISVVGLGALLSALVPFTHPAALLHDPQGPSYLFLAGVLSAAQPRYLVTLHADTLEPLPVDVRVGQEVDVVGQAGRPKTVTGFQTHSTPVLLGHKERAELAGEEGQYKLYAPILEDVVLIEQSKYEQSK